MLLIGMRIPASPPTLYSHRRSKEWNKISEGPSAKHKRRKFGVQVMCRKITTSILFQFYSLLSSSSKAVFPLVGTLLMDEVTAKCSLSSRGNHFIPNHLLMYMFEQCFLLFFFVKGFLNMYIYRENVRHSFSRTRNSIQ